MDFVASTRSEEGVRGLVRFYLVDHKTILGKLIDISLLALNLLFVAIFVAQTYPLEPGVRELLWRLEVVIAAVFLCEYTLRIYGAPERAAEILNTYSLIDIVAVVPTFVVLFLPVSAVAPNIGFLRVLRVVRVLRFYRFTKDAEFFFGTITDNTLRAVKLLLTVLVIFFVSAGLFFSVEQRVNPEIATFGDAFYYIVVTVSTVGFGDILPMTTAGRWVTVATILTGIIVIPWQAGKIVKEWQTRDGKAVTCPDCGLAYHDPDASHCKACGHVIYQEHDPRE